MPIKKKVEDGYMFPGTKLTLIENLPSEKGKSIIRCSCDCGKEWVGRLSKVLDGSNKACGCLVGKAQAVKHGLCNHPLYSVWRSMIQRCERPKHKHYDIYGGRGITVTPEWRNDFKAFHDWATENGWKTGLQLDRVDNNGSYSPQNCQFVTGKENSQNTRICRRITIDGETRSLSEWAKHAGISKTTISNRLNKGMKDGDLLYKKTR